jgi:tripartite-type tricarboxylate transporter receptor subunit TctC
MNKTLLLLVACLFALCIASGTGRAAAPYYEGKVITIIVGYQAGGGYDRTARVIAKVLPKHIPGKPSIIIQNMPGGSSMIAANQLYHKTDPDGTNILATSRGIVFMQLLKIEGVRYDVTKMPYLGSASADSIVLCIRSDLPYKTAQELVQSKKGIFLGITGPADITAQVSHISKDYILGPATKLVQYRSGTEVMLAIERKEVDGVWIAYNSGRPYIERGLLRPIIRARVVQKGIEHLPVNEDLTQDPAGKTIMAMMGTTGEMGRPFLTTPGTPANILGMLRDAFAQTLKDPEFLSDAEKSQMEPKYISPEECVKLTNYLLQQPPEMVKLFGKYVKF